MDGFAFAAGFGYPGRIDLTEHVWLTFAGVEGHAVVDLNGQKLGDLDGLGEFEVTQLLQQRNLVVVDVECTCQREWIVRRGGPGGATRVFAAGLFSSGR